MVLENLNNDIQEVEDDSTEAQKVINKHANFLITNVKLQESVEEYITNVMIIDKVLRTLTPIFNHIVVSIEE
ncbi:hypothetical protein CR513_56132, partial [Mucuna pruriens]